MATISLSACARRTAAAMAAAAVALCLQGCSREHLLEVEHPDVIDPDALDSPQGVSALHAGAVGEFVFQMDHLNGIALFAGLFTDETMHATAPPAVTEWDLRNVPASNVISAEILLNLQRARARSEDAARRIAALITGDDPRVGELWAIAGFTYILLAEMYCSGVPVSSAEPLEYGSPLSTVQLLDAALERLTTAGSTTAGDSRIVNLVAVLRGRALLGKGEFAQAGQAVAAVPTGYVYQLFHSSATPRQRNQIPGRFTSDVYSVSNREGTNGLNFATAADPRVPTRSTGLSRNDGVTVMVQFTKYTTNADPVTQASGIEARLIEAEAALQASEVTLFLSKLNAARATVPALGPLADPGTTAARVDLLFRERAFWLYLTAHRLGDLRRLIRQYGRPAESVFPTGAYHKQGLTRGTQVSFVVPQPEENNPHYTASACDPTRP